MGNYTEYKLIIGMTEAQLSAFVTEYLSNGWSLYSSPFAESHGYYCQAMVK
jgi:hypothetical protein